MHHEGTDLALLLGAGFSRYAGLPVMTGFGRASRTELANLMSVAKNSLTGSAARSAPMLVDAGRVFEGFRDACREAAGFVEIDVENMEDVFCVAEALRESHVPEEGPEADDAKIRIGGDSYSIDYLIEQIQLWLWQIYQSMPPIDKPELERPYTLFLEGVKSLGLDRRLTVLTTNYDMLFEYVAYRAKLEFGYGVSCPDELNVGLGGSQFRRGYGFRLLKLHGSVNFFEGANLNSRGMYGGEATRDWFGVCTEMAKAGDQIAGSRIPSERPTIFAVGTIWALRAKYPHLRLAIIPPTYAKLQGRPWLRQIWQEAQDALACTKAIVIIGYSMPPSDGFMRAMIQAAMLRRRRPLKVLVVDPCQEHLARYRRMFAPIAGQFVGCESRFEDWIANGGASTLADLLR